MSVIITGMRMPQSCPDCPLIQYDDYACGLPFYCPVANINFGEDEYYSMENKDERCPLEELEQKTGKWITYERECFGENTTEPWHKCTCGYETRSKTAYCPNCGERKEE